MKTDRCFFKNISEKIFNLAGIAINGDNPWDIKVLNEGFYVRALSRYSLGLGESYMDGWWDCERLDELFCRILRTRLHEKARRNLTVLLNVLLARIINMQSRGRAFQVAQRHYDLGNELFRNMLDRRMTYSCAYWKDARTLDEAQERKLDMICRKLGLRRGMKVLDIGCGWGSFAGYAAERYGVEVTGITVSREQVEFGRRLLKGLPVDIRLEDYRDLNGRFDHVVSIGMFEHVGYKNYREFMRVVHRCLKDDGLFLLHTIGRNESAASLDPWVVKYIFPNSMLPSIRQIGGAVEGLFVMEDWHSFGDHYDRTLMAWHRNFTDNWHKIESGYDERFRRMWTQYLLMCAAAFRARVNQLWQVVLSKNGIPGGYEPIR
jgi:cyclopropane-fatty-acyl-phospholipid synthase